MIEITFQEKDLEDFLCKNNNLYKYLGLKFVARQVKTPVGILDILAYNPVAKMYVLIELKRGELDIAAYHQLQRYYYYFRSKAKVACDRRENLLWNSGFRGFEGRARDFQKLLIGKTLSKELDYSVESYEQDQSHVVEYTNTFYTLFGIDFDRGLDFNWLSDSQNKCRDFYYGGEDA